jgi:hypothetical protein
MGQVRLRLKLRDPMKTTGMAGLGRLVNKYRLDAVHRKNFCSE